MVDSGTYTPETIARRIEIAKSLLGDPKRPITHWAQGLDELAKGYFGGKLFSGAENAEKSNSDAQTKALAALLGGGTPDAGTTPASPMSAAPVSAPADAGGDTSLPRGLRNNNPLNIEAGSFTQGQPGFAGSDGRFARFETPDAGIGAANKLLDIYQNKHGLNTVAGVLSRWAPAADGNNVSAYASNVSKQLGIDPNAPIPPEMRPQLIAAMAQHENGRPLPPSFMSGAPQPAAQGQTQPYQVAQAGDGMPPAAPQQAIPPQQVAQAQPSPQGAPSPIAGGDTKAKIVQMLNSPNPAVQRMGRQLATGLVQKQFTEDVPTNDMKEYKAAVAQGFKGTLLDYQTKLKEAGKPVTTIDQRAPDAFESQYGQGQAKRAEAVVAEGDKASGIYQRNQVLRTLNNAIQSGKITPATSTIGSWAKSVGIDPAVLGIDPNLPVNAETFNALSNESMMSKLGPGGFPSQNFSDTDRKFLEKTVTNLGDQPGANELKLAISDRVSQLQMEKADRWQEISTSVPRNQRSDAYEKFERDWRKEMKSRNVFGDLIEKIGGQTPGANPGVRRYNPATGKIE